MKSDEVEQEEGMNENNSNSNVSENKHNHNHNNSNTQIHEDDIIGEETQSRSGVLTDKSPFKTTYISHEEEVELKTTNCTLYSQFHHARQAIYQQYQQKVEAIRHSNLLTAEKRKLNIKVAAIDAKVQEKKLFLSYLEMSKPQPNSWLISNSALSMNGFARKIANQQQTPSLYTSANHPDRDGKHQHQQKHKHKHSNNSQSTLKQEEDPSNSENINSATHTSSASIELSSNPAISNKATSIAKRVKKPKFSEFNVRVLRDWYETHTNNPYPSSSEKHLMCQLTGLTKYQVSRWFCNVRTRKPPPELSDNDEDLMAKSSSSPPPPPPPPPPLHSHANSESGAAYNGYISAAAPPPPPLQHPLTPISPYNLPPLPITPNHPYSFTPMNINLPPITPMSTTSTGTHTHSKYSHQAQFRGNIHSHTQHAENMIDCDHSDGLMPAINSNFNHQTPLNPPPLIDENSKDMVTATNAK